MRIKCFAVSGFKNFTQEVVLDDMGEICVIHGENNVGKSNLLEAMQLFFGLLSEDSIKNGDSKQLTEILKQLGFELRNILNLVQPIPIVLQAIFSLNPIEIKNKAEELSFVPLLQSSETQPHEILIEIKINHSQIRTNIDFQLENSLRTIFEVESSFLDAVVLAAISDTFSPLTQKVYDNFILIGTDRRISIDEADTVREIIPQPLRLALYDIKESFEPMIAKRWKLFVKTMSRFNDILGEGEFVALYDRHANKADLVFDTGDKRIPVNLLGSGIQQVVALIARLLVSNATFVAIEEPELNLRYTLQLRLYEVFKEIVADPAGVNQIFLTSHSPAFEHGEHFYHMHTSEHGVTVEKRPISQARMATGMNCDDSLTGKNAPYSYVTSEGLVRLPEHLLKDLNIPYGGGIFILKRKDNEHVELLTDEQYFNLFESTDEEASEHE